MEQSESKKGENKRVFGWLEVGFDAIYLITAFCIGVFSLFKSSSLSQTLVSAIIFTLAIGDSFHLIPRMLSVIRENSASYLKAMGWGKFASSISMTLFYVLLWHLGTEVFNSDSSTGLLGIAPVYVLAVIRIALCLFPQNNWLSMVHSDKWAIFRNLPFVALGAIVFSLYFSNRFASVSLSYMWVAILLSFAFYLPVVLFVNRNQKLGMLMLPKTCMYVWMLIMLLNTI